MRLSPPKGSHNLPLTMSSKFVPQRVVREVPNWVTEFVPNRVVPFCHPWGHLCLRVSHPKGRIRH